MTEEIGALSRNAAGLFALVIDDQEAVSQFIAKALTGFGVDSKAYGTAKPAIASLDQRRPDIIFLDIALEQSDAIEVIKGLSEKHYTGIVQLISGGRPWLIDVVQRTGKRYGLNLRPPLQKPIGVAALQESIVSVDSVRSSA
jgi:DNA-binding NtrC family response regulator